MDNKKRKEKREKIEKDFEKSMRDLEKQVEDLKESGVIDPNKIKVIKIKLPNIDPKKKKLLFITEIIISLLLFFGLSGYIKWVDYPELFYFFIAGGIYVFTEVIFRKAIDLLLPKFAVYSLGAFSIIAGMIAFVLTMFFAPGIIITSTLGAIMFYIAFIIIRSLVKGLIIDRMFSRKRV
ncbi:MAG TPA: hypothetical protein VJZ51_05510 [Bacilli bacterium]|nr:hypothetical protein [Bacilli bacterium]